MRKMLLLFAVLFATTIGLNAQNCNLKGVVKYEYNDYVGYKIDEGAEIYIISTNNAEGVNAQTWLEYERLAKGYMRYLKYQNDDDIRYLGDATIRRFAEFSKSQESSLKELDKKCFEQHAFITNNAEYIELVDGTGKYALQLPYGEYYVLVKSKNRERPLVTELTGRVLVEKVKIDKPSKILSFDFCY